MEPPGHPQPDGRRARGSDDQPAPQGPAQVRSRLRRRHLEV